jgi:predicted GTPase
VNNNIVKFDWSDVKMQEALFIKATKNMQLKDVIHKLHSLKKGKSKKIEYTTLIELILDTPTFQAISNPIIQINDIYCKYGEQSCPDEFGNWQCIVIINVDTSEKYAIYTGGRTIPLYVSFL